MYAGITGSKTFFFFNMQFASHTTFSESDNYYVCVVYHCVCVCVVCVRVCMCVCVWRVYCVLHLLAREFPYGLCGALIILLL